MMPSFFIAHGAPLLAIEDNKYTQYLGELGKKFPRPKAVILFSAHWELPIQTVSEVEKYDTIHDFGGFPKALFQIQYPAEGDPELAKKIENQFAAKGIDYAVDSNRGLDHGAWVVLRMMYPDADIPVISMSVNPRISPKEQYDIGKALADLREEDVMVIASGGTVHNLFEARLDLDDDVVEEWAPEFDGWLNEHIKAWDTDTLFDYENLAPSANKAVPPFGREHFIPIFYAMGAADNERKASLLHQSYRYRNLSHTVWQFG